MLRRLPWRTFLSAFVLSLCVLGLLGAFFVIECRIRRTVHGQVDLGVTYVMVDGVPAVRVDGEPLAAPPAATQIAEVAVPPPVRLFAAVWQWECEMAEWVWEWVGT